MESYITMLMINFIKVLKKFTVFAGRSGRREFWMFVLCNIIVGIALSILGNIPLIGKLFYVVSILYSLAVLIPGIAVGIRRLHDTNRTGLLMLLVLIPGLGAIIVLVLCAMEGTSGENQYGPDPKNEA